jgi:hypothetical protein
MEVNWVSKAAYYQLPAYEEEQETIRQCLALIEKHYPLKEANSATELALQHQLSPFSLLKGYELVMLSAAYSLQLPGGKAFFLVLSINSEVSRLQGRNQILRENLTELEFVGFLPLKQDYGQVYIRPETLADKLNEFFAPREIDFAEDKEFSRKYYLLASDEAKLRSRIKPEFLAAIRKYNGLEIEIRGNKLLVRMRKRASLTTAATLVDFMAKVQDGIN